MNLRDDAGIGLAATAQPDWAALLALPARTAVAEAWLGWLWPQLPQPLRAAVLFDDGHHLLQAVASLPAGQGLQHLSPWVAQSAATGQPLLLADEQRPGRPWILVQPAVLDGRVRLAVCLELAAGPADEAERAAATVLWGLGWLVAALTGGQQGQADKHLQRSRAMFDLTLATLSHDSFDQAALAAVNGLAQRHQATLVQLGWRDGHGLALRARSNTAWHDERSALVLLAEQAMNEALDERRSLLLHTADFTGASTVTPPLAYAREAGAMALAVVLLQVHEHAIGALLVERPQAFSADDLASLEAQALLLAPLLALKQHATRSLWAHGRERLGAATRALTDASRPGLKLGLAAAALWLVVAALLPVTYRISAPSVVEGAVQRAAVAPFAGFIRDAPVRAGDTVQRGQLLARLDDKDLQLEKARWDAEREVALRKEREALASGNRVDQRLASAQAAQASAMLELAQDRLARTEIVAPFDGVVVRGDLSQQLGSPVELGKLLFELAPLDAWRVILKIDERDIARVQPGQRGELVLASLPGQTQAFTVKRITSVAVAEEGRNFFRVEAELAEKTAPLRPGMEGVAKVDAGTEPLLWVWTHRWVDWLRFTAWEWRP